MRSEPVDKMRGWVGGAAFSGSVAGASSVAALALLAVVEGKGAPQALNATSHWLHGPRAAEVDAFDLAHTGVGTATHLAATIFWAAFFEAWIIARPTKGVRDATVRAAAVSLLAAGVDYTITPKRFTPGWEYVLSKPAMALVYGAMAAGLAGSTLLKARRGSR